MEIDTTTLNYKEADSVQKHTSLRISQYLEFAGTRELNCSDQLLGRWGPWGRRRRRELLWSKSVTARVKAQSGSSDSCSGESVKSCCPAWQSPAPRTLLPLIWFTKGDCLNGAASSWSVSSLLEAFLTPISWLDSFFKSFLGEVDLSPISHLVPFLNYFASLRSFRERIYL